MAGPRGFTLLELLVSLMVFAALAALVYGTVRMGSRSWQTGTERIEASDALRVGWRFVQRALSDARPEPSLIPDVPGVHFVGGPSAVEFVADLPAHLGVGGLHLLSLGLEGDVVTGRGHLVLRRSPLPRPAAAEDGRQAPQPLQATVLAEDVTALAIRYFGRIAEREVPEWHSQWQQQETLPRLVLVVVQLREGAGWPLLVAHPRLDRQGAEPDALPPDAIEEAGRNATVD